MGLKDIFKRSDNLDDVPPPDGPPPSYQQSSSSNSKTDYAPPTGPPPGKRQTTDYAPPPGPPPGKEQHPTDYAPPPGPPPSQHNWQSVPLPEDTSGYPPPPDIFRGHDRSWAANATEDQAADGERWCHRYALLPPRQPTDPSLHQPLALITPASRTFHGTITPAAGGNNTWRIRTDEQNYDNTVTAQPPLYVAGRDDPRVNGGRPKTVYFEVRLLRDAASDAGVGIGFVALPYPAFRMPGWHRGSLAVHSDDGHRYVNDRWGGIDFVRPWGKKGEVVGIGMTFSAPGGTGPPVGVGGVHAMEVKVFFTRNGKVDGEWDVNEPRDNDRDLEPIGVQGFHDLVAAVGSFSKTEFEVVLDPARWKYKGVQL